MTEAHGISRRNLIAAGTLAGGMSCAEAFAATPDPRTSAVGQVKLAATLDGSPAYWTYSGTIYGIRPNLKPVALLGLTGCQAQWAKRQDDGSYHLKANVLTYFRSVETGAFIDVFDNPFTARRNQVRANMFSGGAYGIYPADGGAMRLSGQIAASESAPNGFNASDPSIPVGRVSWSVDRDVVVLSADHSLNVRVQPHLEAQTQTADRRRFFDPRVKRLPARYAATTISPWLGWMEMADAPGHVVWHTSGEKVFAVTDLPQDFRRRAGNLMEQLTATPSF